MKKVLFQRKYRLTHEGMVWLIDLAVWKGESHSELRVYRIEGDINTPLLQEALELEAATRGAALLMASELKQTKEA